MNHGKITSLIRISAGALFTVLLGAAAVPAAAEDAAKGNIAVFTLEQTNLQLTALSGKIDEAINDAFRQLGRLLPVDSGRLRKALEALPEKNEGDPYRTAAEALKLDLFTVVSINSMGNDIIGTITIVPLTARYQRLKKTLSVRSRIPLNIPLKLAREIAALHRDLPIEADIIERRADGSCLINAGQWHGLAPGRFQTAGGETIILKTVGRYQSLAELPASMKEARGFTIPVYPTAGKTIRELEERIDFNANYRYGLANTGIKGVDPEKKFAEGMCLVNPGANACLPGYGSYLATSFVGFKKTTPSIPGIIASTALVITHFILPEAMGKFKINFFPGVMDSDKTRNLNNLQIFCWATLPLTVSVAYLDQLSHQFTTNSILPPFFLNRNETALVLSALIPGGGYFYKGYRLPGWSFYLSELFLAGLCVYKKDDKRYVMYGGIALGGVKLVELISVFFCRSSYSFHNIEREGAIQPGALSMSIDPAESGDLVYHAGYTMRFR